MFVVELFNSCQKVRDWSSLFEFVRVEKHGILHNDMSLSNF